MCNSKVFEKFGSFNFGNTSAIYCKYPRVIYSAKFHLSVCSVHFEIDVHRLGGGFILHAQFYQEETYQTGHGENRGWKINIFIDYHLGNLGLVEEEIGSGFRIYHQNLAGPHVEEVQQAFELVLLQPEVVSKSHCPTPYARCAAFIC